MGKGRKNADKGRYVPRAPRTTLDFLENGDRKFEELCCDLMVEEPGIEDAYLYGRQRQDQFGIDVYAERDNDSGVEVTSPASATRRYARERSSPPSLRIS